MKTLAIAAAAAFLALSGTAFAADDHMSSSQGAMSADTMHSDNMSSDAMHDGMKDKKKHHKKKAHSDAMSGSMQGDSMPRFSRFRSNPTNGLNRDLTAFAPE